MTYFHYMLVLSALSMTIFGFAAGYSVFETAGLSLASVLAVGVILRVVFRRDRVMLNKKIAFPPPVDMQKRREEEHERERFWKEVRSRNLLDIDSFTVRDGDDELIRERISAPGPFGRLEEGWLVRITSSGGRPHRVDLYQGCDLETAKRSLHVLQVLKTNSPMRELHHYYRGLVVRGPGAGEAQIWEYHRYY